MSWQAFPPESKGAGVWLDFIDTDYTYYLLEGAVRSSKSFCSIMAWADFIENKCPPGPVAMFGRTERTLQQNILDPLKDLVGPQNCRVNRGLGLLYLFGRPIYLIGCNNVDAVTKIQGKGLVAGYLDEFSTYPEPVFQMIGSRSSATGMKLIGTCNPQGPKHYTKVDYLDRLEDIDGTSYHFELDDNPFLSEKVKQRLRKQYTGLYYQRYILGKWVQADGAVFDFWDESKFVIHDCDLPRKYSAVVVGCDYGVSNATAIIMIGKAADGGFLFTYVCEVVFGS